MRDFAFGSRAIGAWLACGMEPRDGPVAGGHGTPQTGKRQRVEAAARHVLEAYDHLAKARNEALAAKEKAEAADESWRAERGAESQESYGSADLASIDAQTTAQMAKRATAQIEVALKYA